MQFRIAVDELKKALSRAQGIVERRSTTPILSHVLLSATKTGGVTVTAFDLDVGVVSEHPAEVLQPGALTLSAKHLFDIVQSLSEPKLTLEKLANQYAEISCGSARFKIVGMPPEEFPKIHDDGGASWAKLRGTTLLEMIRKTGFAISTDDTRYVLNGVLLEPQADGAVRMVATDGHRLCLVERPLEGTLPVKSGVIIPRKGLHELRRLLDEAPDAEGELGFSQSLAFYRRPGLTLSMRLLDGQFPEYQRVIPKPAEKSLLIAKSKLAEALKRMALLSVEKSNAVRLTLSENVLRIASRNPDLGEAQEDLEVAYDGPAVDVAFNARYLTDVLSVLETDEVALELADEHSPGVLRPPGDRSYTAVVMPMRI